MKRPQRHLFRLTACFAVLLGLGAKADPLSAAEIYVLRFQARGPLLDPATCLTANWWDHLFFHNTTNENKTVRLLGVSNGFINPMAQDLLIPAGRTRDVAGTQLNWNPGTGAYIWSNRLEVPDGVVATSRLEVRTGIAAPCPISSDTTILGALPIPFFKELAPASSAQYHLATDLGRDSIGFSADARISVGIYNAGTAPGNAAIEIRRSCDDRIIDFRSLVVPANSVVQSVGLSTDTGGDCSVSSGNPPPYSSYAVVRIDQPSFSYAITASNEIPPKIPVGVSFTR